MRFRYLALLVVVVPPVVVSLVLMALATIRQRNMSECRNCGMRKVRPPWQRGMLEYTLAQVGLTPYKCDGCLRGSMARGIDLGGGKTNSRNEVYAVPAQPRVPSGLMCATLRPVHAPPSSLEYLSALGSDLFGIGSSRADSSSRLGISLGHTWGSNHEDHRPRQNLH